MEAQINDPLIQQLKDIVNKNLEDQTKKLISQWRQIIQESEEIFEQFRSNTEKEASEQHKQISMILEKISTAIDHYHQMNFFENNVGDLEDEIKQIGHSLERCYRKLSLVYFEYLKKEISSQQDTMNSLINQSENLNEKVKENNLKLEGLGATFLNIVLTISITSTMITILNNTEPKYSLAIILGCAWLLLSSIIFVGQFFKSEKIKALPTIIYIILTIVTFCWFGRCLLEDEVNEPVNQKNEVNSYAEINNGAENTIDNQENDDLDNKK